VSGLREFAHEYDRKLKATRGNLAGLLRQFDDLHFDSLTLPIGKKRKEISDGLQAWLRLKNKENAFEDAITELFKYFGFAVEEKSPVTSERSAQSWRACRVRMNDGGMSPVPQFGSACESEYRVLCAWERPGVDAISGIFHQLSREPTILLYLGRLADPQRLSLRNGARQQDNAVICIDETVVVFLAGERDLRLRALFDCTLPYAVLNPYTPFQAGDVPREMYFGRRDIAGRLKDPSGSCIVYGGRQLGKSALLRKVQRDFHSPDRNQYATVLDIKLLGDPAAREDPASFWPRLRDELLRVGFSTRKTTSEDADRICDAIRSQCAEKDCRLLLLLDEADNLLDYDSRHSFRIVDKLRELMANTGRRFKVVLAGLHNVQRFQGLPNQPLAHFGEAIQVGPLEPADAIDLVVAPLAALGFEFESPNDILRILSYTNYHPGLIQLFCYELVRLLHGRPIQVQPPIRIRRENVEAVYLKEQVRDGIRQRFDWTLALDTRYQVVAWAVIHELNERRSQEPLTASRILELAREWWEAGFESGLDELHGLLDEMCGLGVLTRGESGYRLRSPNVVRLIGDVEARLLELGDMKPPPAFDAAQHHRPLGQGTHSPLTFDDERRVLGTESGVVLLFGSNALGLDRLPHALEGLTRASSEGRGHVFTIPDHAVREDIRAWLEANAEGLPANARAVFHTRLHTTDTEALERVVEDVQRFCAGFRRRTQVVRVLLAFQPLALAAWLASSQHEVLETGFSTVQLKKWTPTGLMARVEQANSMGQIPELLHATGGWDLLLEEVFASANGNDLKPGGERVLKGLIDPLSPIRRRFLLAAGLEDERQRELLVAILKYTSSGELSPEFLPELGELLRDEIAWLDQGTMNLTLSWFERLGLTQHHDGKRRIDPVVVRALRAT
jgi:hypothetical protein